MTLTQKQILDKIGQYRETIERESVLYKLYLFVNSIGANVNRFHPLQMQFMLFDNNVVVLAKQDDGKNKGVIELSMIAIRPSAQGQGYFSKAMELLKQFQNENAITYRGKAAPIKLNDDIETFFDFPMSYKGHTIGHPTKNERKIKEWELKLIRKYGFRKRGEWLYLEPDSKL